MATKESISIQHPFKALGRIPGANILIPLLLGVFMNTFFPEVFPTLGSFTAAMTVKGTAALVGAFMLCVGATISFKSAPKAALRGAIIIISKVVFCVALGLAVLFFLNDNLLGLSSMVILAACSGANNSMYAGLMADYGNEYEQGAVAITTLVVGPPVTMLALGATGQSPINWSLLGAVLPIIIGILLGNFFPSMKKMLTSALPAIIVMTFFAMGTTMKFDSLIMAGPAGILLGVICSVCGGFINYFVDRATGGTGIAGVAISSCAGANALTPAAMAEANPALYGGAALATANAQVAAAVIVTAILTPLITGYVAEHFAKKDNASEEVVEAA